MWPKGCHCAAAALMPTAWLEGAFNALAVTQQTSSEQCQAPGARQHARPGREARMCSPQLPREPGVCRDAPIPKQPGGKRRNAELVRKRHPCHRPLASPSALLRGARQGGVDLVPECAPRVPAGKKVENHCFHGEAGTEPMPLIVDQVLAPSGGRAAHRRQAAVASRTAWQRRVHGAHQTLAVLNSHLPGLRSERLLRLAHGPQGLRLSLRPPLSGLVGLCSRCLCSYGSRGPPSTRCYGRNAHW